VSHYATTHNMSATEADGDKADAKVAVLLRLIMDLNVNDKTVKLINSSQQKSII
jgi:hypothetical protein